MGIRRFRAAASLKRKERYRGKSRRPGYPPLSGGGLIEAKQYKEHNDCTVKYPPLSGGGLIEATLIFTFSAFSALYPPLSGGGLIEATH